MKALFHFTAPLLALITMIACTELEVSENPQNSNNELLQKLSITGKDFKFDGKTRSSVNIGESGASFTWDEDDVIGIFPDKGDQVSFAMDEGAGTQTATFSGGGWALKSSAKYAAYYPHVYENRDLTAIPVSYVDQTQNGNANTDHIGAYDFMAAGVSTPENGAVAFDMQHLGALVQLSITVPEPSTITKVVLTSSTEFTETGTIDLTADTPAIIAVTQSNIFEIALNNVATTEANEDVIIYFMTAPIDLTDSELTATIHLADETTCEVELTGKNFQAGKAYKLAEKAEKTIDYIDEYGINHGHGVKIGEAVWAPVNCGYHKTDYPYGKLYQWGRKYGQGYDASDATYPSVEKGTIIEGPISVFGGQSKENKDIFFTSNAYINWVYPVYATSWNLGTESAPEKNINDDPCPNGWRVPTYEELKEIVTNHSEWTTNSAGQKGYWFSGAIPYSDEESQVFFPAAGCRDNWDGTAHSRGNFSYYWSSTADSSHAYYLGFYSNNIEFFPYNYSNTLKPHGYSVRCIQDLNSLDKEGEDIVVPESIPVSNIWLASKSIDELCVGDKARIMIKIMPIDATDKNLVWSSDAPTIAVVNQYGEVTAISDGTAIISAEANGIMVNCTVNVVSRANAVTDYVDEYGINH